MNILYVLHSVSAPSGGVRIVLEHCWRLRERGHNCSIATLDNSTDYSWYSTTVDINALGRALMEPTAERADAVVATEANTVQPVMNLETNARRYLFMQMRESLFFLRSKPMWAGAVEESYRKARGILQPIVISQWLKDFLENEYGYENIPIVPNGVNIQQFYPDPVFPNPIGFKRILIEGFPGNEAKDTDLMAYQAAQKIQVEYGNIELWGFSQASSYGNFHRYWRYPNQALIRQLYSSADILLKASKFEGRSCVEVEAMACGTAVCRAILTGDDDLEDGYNCLKVKYGDTRGFNKNLRKLVRNDELRNQLAENGLEFVKEKLGWEDKIDMLETIYGSA